MSSNDKQLISGEDEELGRIRERKLKELMMRGMKNQEATTKPVTLSDSTFEKIVAENRLVLVDFWASWCGPCRVMSPTVEDIAKDYAGQVLVGKLNVDTNPKTPERFHIYGIPTLLITKSGKEVDRIVGVVPKNQIETLLKKHLE